MAGGRASRFARPVEKGLLRVGGASLLQRSMNALQDDRFDRVLVATSPHTPVTARKADEAGLEVVATRGNGYHEDIVELLNVHDVFLSLNVDVPFVRSEHVKLFLDGYAGGSLAAVVSVPDDGPMPKSGSMAFDGGRKGYVWIGLNVVTGDPETATYEMSDPLLAMNINDEDDLALADSIANERGL